MLQRRQRLSSVTHEQSPPKKKAKLSPAQTSKTKVKVLSKGSSSKQKKNKKASDKKNNNTKRIETTSKHYELIDTILQFSVHYCHPLGRLDAYSAFSKEGLPFFAFPVFTRKPVGRAQLPVVPESDKSDVGFFMGAAHPGHIRLAVIDAFCTSFPDEDPKAARWEYWDVWQYLSCYYPPDIFNRKPETLQDLADDILTGREFGGLGRTYPKIVSTIDQKLYKYAVWFTDYYDAVGSPLEKDSLVNRLNPKNFFSMNTLLTLHEKFKKKLSEKKGEASDDPVELKKKPTKKRLQKAEEMDVDSDESSDDDENQPSQGDDADSSDDEPSENGGQPQSEADTGDN